MAELEKVLKGLEHHVGLGVCKGCPYYEDCDIEGEIAKRLLGDTVELLKAQEPVEPKIVGRETHWYECECGTGIDYKDPYCRGCGRPVKWDG